LPVVPAPVTTKVLHANDISRQCGATAVAGFQLLTSKNGVW
jgi:hypothetical protein